MGKGLQEVSFNAKICVKNSFKKCRCIRVNEILLECSSCICFERTLNRDGMAMYLIKV